MVKSKRVLAFLAGLTVCFAAFGQSGDFQTTGTVMSGGKALQMATITYTSVAQRLSWDFSKADGTFGLGALSTSQPLTRPEATLTLPSSGQVTIDVFEMTGKHVGTVLEKLDKGMYTLQPLQARLSQSMYMLKITSGKSVSYQRLLNTNIGNSKSISLESSNQPLVMAKELAAIDTVRVGKTGYLPVFVPITAYTSSAGTVTLTAINIQNRVDSIYNLLSQTQQVGQLCMPILTPAPLSTGTLVSNNVGAEFGGGGAAQQLGGWGNASGCASQINTFQNAMMGGGMHIPLLIAMDMVHGASAVEGVTYFPHNMALGAIQDTLLLQKAFRVVALEIRGTGFNWGFGPCIAVIRDDRWGRAYEGFSETPGRTALMARNAILGCQTTDLSLPSAYAACVKHFAGDGNTSQGINMGTTLGPDATARAINLPGYAAAVAAGAATVMPSFSSWCDGTPMHTNSTLMTGWLKSTAAGNPGFQGFIVSDWDAANPLQTSINAGVDMPMISASGTGAIGSINAFYGSRVQDACKRVLRVKCWMNLFDRSQYIANSQLTSLVGCAAHRAVARACVRAACVLLKKQQLRTSYSKNRKRCSLGTGWKRCRCSMRRMDS